MNQQDIIRDLEDRARDAGVSIRQVCIKADLHPTTFSRWKQSDQNPIPIGASIASIAKLEAALTALEAHPS